MKTEIIENVPNKRRRKTYVTEQAINAVQNLPQEVRKLLPEKFHGTDPDDIKEAIKEYSDPDMLSKAITKDLSWLDAKITLCYAHAIKTVENVMANGERSTFDERQLRAAERFITLACNRLPKVTAYKPQVEIDGNRYEIPTARMAWTIRDDELHFKSTLKLFANQNQGGCHANKGGPCWMKEHSFDYNKAAGEAAGGDVGDTIVPDE